MKKGKKLCISITAGVLAVGLAAGGGVYLARQGGDPVHVYNITENMIYTDYWGDSNYSSGMVTTDRLQTVFLSATQEVTAVNVQEGQRVTAGTALITYDTTLSQLSLDRQELEIQRNKLRLEDARDQLAAIRRMKPISYTTRPTTRPTTAPTTSQPDGDLGEDEAYRVLGGAGTSEANPKVVWAKQDTTFNDQLMEELLGGSSSIYVVVEVRAGDKATGEVENRIGMKIDRISEEVAASLSAGGGGYSLSLLTEVTTEEPSPQTEEGTTSDTNPPETTEETGATEPEPTEPEPTEPEPTEPEPTTPPTVTVNRYNITFFPATEVTIPDDSGDTGGGTDIDYNSGYTASEIAQMRADKEAEIKELQFTIEMGEAELKIMQKEFDNGVVTSEIDGYVVSVLSPEEALANNEPVVKVSGGGGFLLQGTVSELRRDSVTLGQTVQVMNYETGMSYEGIVTEVSQYPVSNSGYMGGNPNVSYYPFTVTIDESANLEAGTYAEITYTTAQPQAGGFYLDSAFIRNENGKSFVYVKNTEDKLEKREITIGMTIYDGRYTQVLEGLTIGDSIAFPYGSGLREGAPTEEAQVSELYETM